MSSSSPKIGVIMDPIAHIKPQKDSTLAMMLGAQKLGARLFYMEQDDLSIKDGRAYAMASAVKVFDNEKRWYALEKPKPMVLGRFDILLMRKDPPVDKRFIHACWVLEQAQRDGARVINDPMALVTYNEKLFATHFPEFCPPYVITSSLGLLREFCAENGRIIIKPLDAMGGQGVFLTDKKDVNFEVVWETLSARGTYPVQAQPFLPEISKGDRRILVFGDDIIEHALVRLPKKGSIRGNLAAGGSYEVQKLNKREREIAEAVSAHIVREGVVFAGLDVIGGYLTEVNITSPTGLRQVSKATREDLGKRLMKKIIG